MDALPPYPVLNPSEIPLYRQAEAPSFWDGAFCSYYHVQGFFHTVKNRWFASKTPCGFSS